MPKKFNTQILQRLFFTLILAHFTTSCLTPTKQFKNTKPPKVPDYTKNSNWAALPLKKDSADLCVYPANIRDKQDSAAVDVFYVHPTTYIYGRKWNASTNNRSVNKITDKHAVRNQASAFNGTGKIYAPRYRQANLYSYSAKATKSGDGAQALDLAYCDVKAAFVYYLKNYNQGRPIILASHSQGTHHAIRLLRDFFENDTLLKKQLVASYIIGLPFKKGEIKGIPPCDSANQTGCYVTWNTVPWGETTLYNIKFDSLECVNPLTWKRDTAFALPINNKGGLPQTFNRVDMALTDAKISTTGLLWIHRPTVPVKNYPTINSKRFHILDYNLFYMNIRENVKLKTERYFLFKR